MTITFFFLYYFTGVIYTWLGVWFFSRKYKTPLWDFDGFMIAFCMLPLMWPLTWVIAFLTGIIFLAKGKHYG